MLHEIIMAGFGGQGIMAMGQLLAYAAMLEGKEVSWMPSYGPEMRGGTANCTVIVSSEKIGSPIVSNPTASIVMNKPSFDKFEPMVKKHGILVVNSSLVEDESQREDLERIYVPANEIANKLGNSKVANMVALGAYVGKTNIVSLDSLEKSLKKVFSNKKKELISLNMKAIRKGMELVNKA